MNAEKLILLTIKYTGPQISGKTLLQKRIYFLSKLLFKDLGYRAHYYGPYSPEVDDGLAKLKALGFLEERGSGFGLFDKMGFEVRRYDYVLTDDGETVVKSLEQRDPKTCENIKQILERMKKSGDTGDYLELSIAAKTYHILSRENNPMNVPAIRSAAKNLGWNIPEDSINNAASFLENLELVERQ